jgi:gliding motility-associated protein GldL
MKIGSKKWKQFMAKLYGWGAAVVIIGALFKIQHWPMAGELLTIGLSTEAVIFFFSAFEPPHEDPDWSLVYPQLRSGEAEESLEVVTAVGDGKGVTQQLDDMLSDAKIGPELIESLGDGFRSIKDQAEKMSDISDAQLATGEYVESVKTASGQVDALSQSYRDASESLSGLSGSSESGANTGEQLDRLASNLEKLNASYESQLEGTSSHVENNAKLSEGIQELLSNLNASIEDTKQYKDNIAELSKSLAALNQVYGNMLNAMNPTNNS